MTATRGAVIVWGNCQAPALASLLRAPLATAGLEVLTVPTVFEATAAEVAWVRDEVTRAALLVTQPIRDEYRHAGCGSEQLAAMLPDSGRAVRLPSVVHTGWFPYQANAHDEDGGRVDAPLVEYHDLRLLAAAAEGASADEVLERWPVTAAADGIRAAAAASVAELQRREAGTDVLASDLVDAPDALFAMNHPSNGVLATLARRVLDHVGVDAPVDVPQREFLGAVRTPLEPHVVAARGEGTARPDWVVRREPVSWEAVVRAQSELYAARPGIPRDARVRFADRLATLGLSPL